jgi:4-amino-4-deoxy-L-arabinose transferase-like glycosyltransferase
VAALKYLNVVLMGVLLALLYAPPYPEAQKTPHRWALLLCLGNFGLSLNAVRLYAETLSALLTVLVIVLLLRLRARPGIRDGVVLGVGVGLALMAKQPAVLLPCLLALLAVVYSVRHQRPLSIALLVALGTAIVVALPFFARNQALIGGPFYPAVTTDAQRTLDALNTRAFSRPVGIFYRSALRAAGPWIPWICVAALVCGFARRLWDLRLGLLTLCLGFVFAAPMVSRFETRHLGPFIAVIALLACVVLYDALPHRRAIGLLIQVFLFGWAVSTVFPMPDYRRALNSPREQQQLFRAVEQHVPAGERVLSLWTYDTFYYSRRDATWPIPWATSAEEIRLFDEADPARFLATLDRLSIGYLVVPRTHQPARFDGVHYTEGFVDCVIQLVRDGDLRVLGQSPGWAVVGRVRQPTSRRLGATDRAPDGARPAAPNATPEVVTTRPGPPTTG